MLKSYEITLEGNQIKWLGEKPKTEITHAILIVEEKEEIKSEKTPQKRTTPEHLKGKMKILGDIVNPIVAEEDWECLK